MFDGLKEKLGRFREDVEETAGERVEEPADGEESVEESADGKEAVEGSADSGEPVEESADGEAAGSADSAVEESAGDADPPTGPGEAGATGVEEAVAEEADADDARAGADDGSTAGESSGDRGTGFARKARSLARGKLVIEAEDLEDPLWDLEMALLDSDVEMSVAEEILDGIRERLVGETRGLTQGTGSVVERALREALLDVISVGRFDFDERIAAADKPVVVIFTGVNGVGKTTTIAKLVRYLEERGFSSVLANGDTYRAGANEQLREHADRLDRKLIAHEQGSDPAAVLYDGVEYAKAHDIDVVLGDTAGRLHTSRDLMAQLEKIDRVVDPDVTLFVDEAVAGQDAVNRAREFDQAAEIDGAILTKADADSQGGAAISIAHVTGKPILFLGVGQGYDDLEPFDPEEMVDRLLGGE